MKKLVTGRLMVNLNTCLPIDSFFISEFKRFCHAHLNYFNRMCTIS